MSAEHPDGLGPRSRELFAVPDRLGSQLQAANAVLRQLPAGAAAALSRVPGTALDPFDRLVVAFLIGRNQAHTKTAYGADLAAWRTWCTDQAPEEYRVHPLAATRPHVDAWVEHLGQTPSARTGQPLSPAASPAASRPWPSATTTSSDSACSTAPHSSGSSAPRSLTSHPPPGSPPPSWSTYSTPPRPTPPLRRADLAAGVHRLPHLQGPGRRHHRLAPRPWPPGAAHPPQGRPPRQTPLTPDVQHALEHAIGERTAGPIFATVSGKALDRTAAWRLLRRLATTAGIHSAERISPHSMRHTFATTALDAGVPLRDVQDSMGHRDPRTTRVYDRTRGNLTRNATYTVASVFADGI